MKNLSKALVATVAAGAVAVSSASPALARDHRGGDGIDAGEVIAGALIIGGIAAVAASASKNDRSDYRYGRDGDRYGRDYRYDRAGYNDRGFGGGNPREAVDKCVRAAEREAGRYSRGRADVTDVRKVRETRNGYEVSGRIAVNGNGRDWRGGDNRYGRGWDNDYRGWNDSMRGYDAGKFQCRVEYGRVASVNFDNVRGL